MTPYRLLSSYAFFADADLPALLGQYMDVPVELFIDSGAYSVMAAGHVLDPAAYTRWVATNGKGAKLIAGPDVIGDPAATELATAKMAKELPGMPILPTFHVGEPWDYLERYVAQYPYVALGGMVPYVRNIRVLEEWLKKAFKRIPTGTKVHAFGVTMPEVLSAYPWTSSDSTSWTVLWRHGLLYLYDYRRNTMRMLFRNNYKELLGATKVLGDYGLSVQDAFLKKGQKITPVPLNLMRASIESYRRVEERTGVEVYLGTNRGTAGGGAPNSIPSIGSLKLGIPYGQPT